MNEEETNFRKKEVIAFFNGLDTWFSLCESEHDDCVSFETRENGCVSSERCGRLDFEEGLRLVGAITKMFPHLLVWVEAVDEWVHVNVKARVADEFSVRFIKCGTNGKGGFTSVFKTLDELKKEYGSWFKTDWNAVASKFEGVEDYPNNEFTGWYWSRKILLSKAGSDGNDWGYDFFVEKGRLVYNLIGNVCPDDVI